MKTNKEILTKENAHRASVISNIKHPEWGTKSFNYNGNRSSHGRGFDSAMLAERISSLANRKL